ncbi:MAG: putative porin [Candidatus Omnitrophota bacterium]|jgi:hypothetical protein
MKKLLCLILAVCFWVSLIITNSYAGEIDILLQKLVEKGVLTGAEAQQIKVETKEAVKKEIVAGKSETLPAWVQAIKIKGDFRGRYQYNHGKSTATSTTERHRARIRLRLGVEGKVNDKLKVGVGLATGLNSTESSSTLSADYARSTNQTLYEGFSKKGIGLDYAYAEYAFSPWGNFIGGKFKNPLWEPGDLIWDTDINPEGAALNLNKKLMLGGLGLNVFSTTGVFPLDESSSSGDDPMMYVQQAGLTHNLTDTISLKTALAYMYTSTQGDTLDGTTSTNTTPLEDFSMLTPAVELKFKEPFKFLGVGFLNIPSLTLFGEYVKNTHAPNDKKDTGFMTGLKFGAEKIEGWGDWQASYNFAALQKDAILDILPDSDRYGGQTGVRAHEAKFSYGLGKNTWFDLDIYRAQRWRAGVARAPETVFQADWNMKF